MNLMRLHSDSQKKSMLRLSSLAKESESVRSEVAKTWPLLDIKTAEISVLNSSLHFSRSEKDFSIPRIKKQVDSASAVMLDWQMTVTEAAPDSAGNPVFMSKIW